MSEGTQPAWLGDIIKGSVDKVVAAHDEGKSGVAEEAYVELLQQIWYLGKEVTSARYGTSNPLKMIPHDVGYYCDVLRRKPGGEKYFAPAYEPK